MAARDARGDQKVECEWLGESGEHDEEGVAAVSDADKKRKIEGENEQIYEDGVMGWRATASFWLD